MICSLFETPTLLFFIHDAPPLLYYSHIPATILALLVGGYVYFKARTELLNRLLFIICIFFSCWTVTNLTLWTNIQSDLLIFLWPLLSVFASLISVYSVYFMYVFLEKRDAPIRMKITFLLLLLPVMLFAPTSVSVFGFDITDCDAFGYEGMLYKIYYVLIGVLGMIWILWMVFSKYRKSAQRVRKQILLMGMGIECFLISFFTLYFISSYLTQIGYLHDSRVEMFGLFGMTIFMIFIGVFIVRFKTFKVGILATQAFVLILILLIGSILFAVRSTSAFVITMITLILSCISGFMLIKSVKKEISQRQKIVDLAKRLKRANTHLISLDKMKSEFVSIASHQLRNPLTSIRGYTSMLTEGSYGKLPKKAQIAISNINESARNMTVLVEDYLNVSRIEAGNMQYSYSEFSVKEFVEKLIDDVRPIAIRKGLLLEYRTACEGKARVRADIGKLRQAVLNILDNALKYTETGSIEVLVTDNLKQRQVTITISDTGVGMSAATIEDLFQKFIRAKNANDINVTGTGLGLYVAKKMVEEMGGTIWAESDGEGKGSHFYIALPFPTRRRKV